MDDELNDSIERLELFASRHAAAETIDSEVLLTVADVMRVIKAARIGGDMVPIRYIDLNDLSKL